MKTYFTQPHDRIFLDMKSQIKNSNECIKETIINTYEEHKKNSYNMLLNIEVTLSKIISNDIFSSIKDDKSKILKARQSKSSISKASGANDVIYTSSKHITSYYSSGNIKVEYKHPEIIKYSDENDIIFRAKVNNNFEFNGEVFIKNKSKLSFGNCRFFSVVSFDNGQQLGSYDLYLDLGFNDIEKNKKILHIDNVKDWKITNNTKAYVYSSEYKNNITEYFPFLSNFSYELKFNNLKIIEYKSKNKVINISDNNEIIIKSCKCEEFRELLDGNNSLFEMGVIDVYNKNKKDDLIIKIISPIVSIDIKNNIEILKVDSIACMCKVNEQSTVYCANHNDNELFNIINNNELFKI